MRVLIFGDSITQGMWDAQGGWANRLVADYFRQQMEDIGLIYWYFLTLG